MRGILRTDKSASTPFEAIARSFTDLQAVADKLYAALDKQEPLHLNEAEAKATAMEAYEAWKAAFEGNSEAKD